MIHNKDRKYYVPIKIDGADSPHWESSDCTVRATKIVLGISYPEAHLLLEKAGRIAKKGFYYFKFAKNHPQFEGIDVSMVRHRSIYAYGYSGYGFGDSTVSMDVNQTTLGRFIEDHPVGRFVVHVKRHVIPIIDGVVYDTQEWGKRKIVYQAWKVTI